MKRLGIFDGDVICHAACEQPWQIKIEAFKRYGVNTDALKGLKAIPGYDPFSDQKMLDICWMQFKKKMAEAKDSLFLSDHVMAVKAGASFRDDMYPEYKRDRGKWRIPNPFVDIVRQRAVEEGYAIFAHGKEADDLLRIWAEECVLYGIDYVIVSIDKDLLCIPGKHYNPKKKELAKMTPVEAMWHYYAQIMAGDPTDHIPGLPQVGFKTAMGLIEGIGAEEEIQEIVVSQYIEKYQDEWENQLLSNGKMIHIQKHWNDYFTISNWPIVQTLRSM